MRHITIIIASVMLACGSDSGPGVGDVPPRVDHRVEIEAAVSLGKRSSGDLLLFVNAVDPFSVSAQGCDERRHALVAA